MLEKGENKEYLPIDGLAAFKKATVELLLGADSDAVKEVRHVFRRGQYTAKYSYSKAKFVVHRVYY